MRGEKLRQQDTVDFIFKIESLVERLKHCKSGEEMGHIFGPYTRPSSLRLNNEAIFATKKKSLETWSLSKVIELEETDTLPQRLRKREIIDDYVERSHRPTLVKRPDPSGTKRAMESPEPHVRRGEKRTEEAHAGVIQTSYVPLLND